MKTNDHPSLDALPAPIDTSGEALSPELIRLTERMAENAHNVWMQGRLREGWRWGPERSDARLETPCLVPYDQLPEGEKEYDRAVATETLKLIQRLGFDIVPRPERGR